MSLTPLRQAAIRSVRQSNVTSRLTTLSMWQRSYTSAADNNNKEATEETKKPDQEEKVPETIEEQLKAQLAEKDKKIAELQVSKKKNTLYNIWEKEKKEKSHRSL